MDADAVLTNDEIEIMATEAWLGVLSQLWTAYGKTPTQAQLTLYSQKLGNIPLGLLEIAVDHVIREHRFSNVPTIGEIWEALVAELHPVSKSFGSIVESIEQWESERWERCFVRFDCVAVETE